jgi:hypothetical protein
MNLNFEISVLKGQCHEIFVSGFFHEIIPTPPASNFATSTTDVVDTSGK